jgi:hypothetical protein
MWKKDAAAAAVERVAAGSLIDTPGRASARFGFGADCGCDGPRQLRDGRSARP